MVSIVQADAIELLSAQPADSIDLVFGSPPYVDCRTYQTATEKIDATYTPEEWVTWMLRVTEAALPCCKGLIAWVVAGAQRKCNYWPACEGLIWEWYKRGNYQWCPSIWWKVDNNEGGTAIPGSGGKQGLRKDWEYVLMFRRDKELAFADNTACGHEPVYSRAGGAMSNRKADGWRINQEARGPWNTAGQCGLGGRRQNGTKKSRIGAKAPNGEQKVEKDRPLPKIANPGNVIRVAENEMERQIVKARVGGGHMGSTLCHDGEAPFPEELAKFFVLSYSPPGGTVCDPFAGSGTTAAVAVEHGRNFVGCDLRQSQVELSLKRVATVTPNLFAAPQEEP